jgi:hypothetical protein
VSELPADLRDAALVVLRDATLWRLPVARWDLLAGLLASAAAAHRAGDAEAFDQATARLEAAGPERITKIGAPPGQPLPEPAPAPVRERLNHLIHALSGPTATPGPSAESPYGASAPLTKSPYGTPAPPRETPYDAHRPGDRP